MVLKIVIFKINLTDNQKQTTSRILSFNSDFSVESALSSVRYIETYQEIVDLFAKGFQDIIPASRGLSAFRSEILEIYNGEEYCNLRQELSKMEVHFGGLKSVPTIDKINEYLNK
mgnify:CR=1 FL=1